MSWKKFGRGVLKGVKVAANFAPVISKFGPIGMGAAVTLRLVAKLDGPHVEPYVELVEHIAQTVKNGWPDYEQVKENAVEYYVNCLRTAGVTEFDASDIDFDVASAIKHVKNEVALDAIEA